MVRWDNDCVFVVLLRHNWPLATDASVAHPHRVRNGVPCSVQGLNRTQFRLRRSVRIDALHDNNVVSFFAYLARTVVGIPLHWHTMIWVPTSRTPWFLRVSFISLLRSFKGYIIMMVNLHQRGNTELPVPVGVAAMDDFEEASCASTASTSHLQGTVSLRADVAKMCR